MQADLRSGRVGKESSGSHLPQVTSVRPVVPDLENGVVERTVEGFSTPGFMKCKVFKHYQQIHKDLATVEESDVETSSLSSLRPEALILDLGP